MKYLFRNIQKNVRIKCKKFLNLKIYQKHGHIYLIKKKNKYYEYANEMNEKRKKRRDFFEIIHGIKPKRPARSYKYF